MSEKFAIKNKKFFLSNLIGIVVLVILGFLMFTSLVEESMTGRLFLVFKFHYTTLFITTFLFFLVLVSSFMNLSLKSSLFESLVPLVLIFGLIIIELFIRFDYISEHNAFAICLLISYLLYFVYLICALFILDKIKWYKYLHLGFPLLYFIAFLFIKVSSTWGYVLLAVIVLFALGISSFSLIKNKENEKRGFLIIATVNLFLITILPLMILMGVASWKLS